MTDKIEKMITNNIDSLWDEICVIAQTDSNIYCMKEDLKNMFLRIISEALAEKDAENDTLNFIRATKDATIEMQKEIISNKDDEIERLKERLRLSEQQETIKRNLGAK